MPRKPRCYAAGIPCHVISRGNDRNLCFFCQKDYLFYLECLNSACVRYKVALHAYVLMTNHVHLLMTPKTSDGISRVMQSIGRRYVQYINHTRQRTGTLWEGRHKSSLVDEENYLLACYRYIELNPVRAKMVGQPEYYQWSSFRENAGIDKRSLVDLHECYRRLGLNRQSREQAYQALFQEELSNELLMEIRRAATFSMPLGDRRFIEHLEELLGRSLGHAKRGRPFKGCG